MAYKILVGVDGSDRSAEALKWAVTEAAARGGSVTAVLAWQLPFDGTGFAPTASTVDGYAAYEQNLLDEVVDRIDVDGLAEQIERVVVPSGHPGSVLVEQGADADLLVVGTRGRGGFLGLLLGSVAEHCLHNATGTIALIPESPLPVSRDSMVGVDGTLLSVEALRWAVDRATAVGGKVSAVYTWSWLNQPKGVEFDAAFGESDAAAHLEKVIVEAGLGDAGIETETINDLPARGLLDRASRAGLLVVGSKRRSAARMALAGSVTRQLAHHTPVPLIVHR